MSCFFRGKEISVGDAVPVGKALAIGRGGPASPKDREGRRADGAERLVLVTDDAAVQDLDGEACQVFAYRENGELFAEDRNAAAFSARLNDAAFTKSRVLINDRISIGDDFHFQYDGVSLCRVKDLQGARIEATRLTKIFGSAWTHRSAAIADLSVTVEPNEFVGILGPSGCGKSTLLGMLAGAVRPTGGRVLIDGVDIHERRDVQQAMVGMVPQDDIVHHELTVWEAVSTNARLRLSGQVPKGEKNDLAESVITKLKLWDRRHHRIGTLSGGQRKRVSIAVELLKKSSALFLDEPSSGLDQAKEEDLMILLRQLSNQGRTIVCTTHVLDRAFLFDRILIIARGTAVYYGRADDAPAYFGRETMQEVYRMIDDPSFVPVEFGGHGNKGDGGGATKVLSALDLDSAKAGDEPYAVHYLDRGAVLNLHVAAPPAARVKRELERMVKDEEPNVFVNLSRVAAANLGALLAELEPVFRTTRQRRVDFTLVADNPEVRAWLRTKRLADRILVFPSLASASSVLHETVGPKGKGWHPVVWAIVALSSVLFLGLLGTLWLLWQQR